ncbi:MAG: DUF4156 domain-containing protein [Gammaproteobacteria bacterium]|jgi:hypothetical protein
MMRKRGRAFLLSLLLASGCTWVALSDDGTRVQVRTPDQVQGCERMNRVTASVKDEVLGIMRSEETVREELQALARNEAARQGGNAVVAETEPSGGRQVFVVYRCP